MDILSGITLLGGLAFFLYGMQVLSAGLERMAGGKLESLLKKMTASPFKSLLLGAGITAAIQSSSAVTVMLVGLVNSGIMTIGQSIGVIMGSNIGTTITSWILTLVGIESDNLFVSLLKPENFSLLFAFVGILLMMSSGSQRRKDIGTILVGFAVLMYGMKLMSGAVKPLANSPAFVSLFTAFRNPILGVLAGLAITAIIQSSSASVGILQALALTGAVSYGAAHHHGSEHRHLRHRHAVQHRRQQKRPEGGRGARCLQPHRHSGVSECLLRGGCPLPLLLHRPAH